MSFNYDELLAQAKEQLPEVKESTERFQIPKVKGQLQGIKTLITNLHQIADFIHRPYKHLLKYLSKELAAPADTVKTITIFGGKLPASKINEKIEKYSKEFVICKECGKPDSKLNKEGDVYYFKCQACGARYTFTAKI